MTQYNATQIDPVYNAGAASYTAGVSSDKITLNRGDHAFESEIYFALLTDGIGSGGFTEKIKAVDIYFNAVEDFATAPEFAIIQNSIAADKTLEADTIPSTTSAVLATSGTQKVTVTIADSNGNHAEASVGENSAFYLKITADCAADTGLSFSDINVKF